MFPDIDNSTLRLYDLPGVHILVTQFRHDLRPCMLYLDELCKSLLRLPTRCYTVHGTLKETYCIHKWLQN